MNLVGIKNDLTSQLQASLVAFDVAGYRSPPADAGFPLFAVHPPERTDYNRTFKSGAEIELLLTLVVSQTETDYAHLMLDSAVSLVDCSDEIADLLESGDPSELALPSIPQLVKSFTSTHWAPGELFVSSHDRYREIQVGAVAGFGVDFTLSVSTPGI